MLRDAEVEQPNCAVVLDEDIRRLQIAMNHRVLVRIQYRLTHRTKQAKPFGHAAMMGSTILGERNAFDILHGEKRRPVERCIRIVTAQ
jgi:hypothetical protein